MEKRSDEFRDNQIGFFSHVVVYGLVALLFIALCLKFQLYLKLLAFPFLAIVILLLTVGSILHAAFSLKCMVDLKSLKTADNLFRIKTNFCKSLCINFILPYTLMIIFFLKYDTKAALDAIGLLSFSTLWLYSTEFKPNMKALLNRSSWSR